jgi:hypothetical protein
MIKAKLGQRFKVTGEWWIPGSPIRRPGTLKYTVERMRLRVSGFLHATAGSTSFDVHPVDQAPEVIHGKSVSGEDITLFKSWYQAWQPLSLMVSDVASATLVTHIMIVGAHFQSPDPLFEACQFRIKGVGQWSRRNAFDTKPDPKNPDTFHTTTTVPTPIQYGTPIGSFLFASSCGFHGGGTKLRIKLGSEIRLTPSSPKTLDWYLEQLRHTERLYTVLFGTPVHTEQVALFPVRTNDIRDSYADRSPLGAKVYSTHKRTQARRLGAFELLIRYDDVESYLPEVFNNWFADYSGVEHAFNLYFATIYRPGDYLENRFLPTVQSLEVLARETYADTYVSKEYYKSIVRGIESSIASGVDEKLVASIAGRLAFANELTLKDRLKTLTGRVEESTRSLFCIDPVKFANGIVNTRNYHTHYSATSGRILRGMDMHWATVKMRMLMTVLLLKRMGLPESMIRDAVSKNHRASSERAAWLKVSESGEKI